MSASNDFGTRINTVLDGISHAIIQRKTVKNDASAPKKEAVTLIAASKTVPSWRVREAIGLGLHAFGENYVQEGVAKIQELADLRPRLKWHLMGPLQSNKTALVAEHFDWVQTLDRAKIATRLNDQRPAGALPLQVLIQINADGSPSKAGVDCTQNITDLLGLAQHIQSLPRLRLRGLMAMPDAAPGPDAQSHAEQVFGKIRTIFDQLNQALAPHPCMDTLSMGMSADHLTAIFCGSTMVRVGSALFGERQSGAV